MVRVGGGELLARIELVNAVGRLLILLGGILVLLGLLVVVSGRLNLPVGRLPGDIVYRGKNSTVYFPIVTSIVLSVLLSVIFYLINRCLR